MATQNKGNRAAAAKKPLPVLTPEQVLSAKDAEEVTIPVPEWGGSVRMRQIARGDHVDALEAAMKGDELDGKLADLYILAATMVEPKFSRDEILQLNQKNAGVVETLIIHAALFNQGGKGAAERLEKSLLETAG